MTDAEILKTPKKPKPSYYYWHCPNCHAIVTGLKVCEKCGQHIDWDFDAEYGKAEMMREEGEE